MKTLHVNVLVVVSILAVTLLTTGYTQAAPPYLSPNTWQRPDLATISFLSPSEAALFGLDEAAIVYRGQDPPAVQPPAIERDPFETEFERWLQESPFAGLFSDAGPASENTPPVLARAPSMFGDFFLSGGVATVPMDTEFADLDLPIAGGSRRVKIAENNKALPVNRVFFVYNHFNNALDVRRSTTRGGPTTSLQSASVDRYTIGLERTMFEGLWSVELRMPFTNDYSVTGADFSLSGGNIGNLAIIFKRLIYANDCLSLVAGLGIDTPTGSGAVGFLPGANVAFTLGNDSLHLLPFVGFLAHPTDRFFYHGFAQLDVATGANMIDVREAGGARDTGRLREQTRLYLDASVGTWLYRCDRRRGLTGLAAVAELHYTTSLEDADSFTSPNFDIDFGNPNNRIDVVNVSVGLHAEFANNTQLRVSGVFPLDQGSNRQFDSELMVAVIKQF